MVASRYRRTARKALALTIALLSMRSTLGELTNLTKNDPYPLYNALYPYDFLAQREKIEGFLLGHDTYEEDRFRISISGFRQEARCASDIFRRETEIGNLPRGQGLNFSALFIDPIIANRLAEILGIPTTPAVTNCESGSPAETIGLSNPNQLCCFNALQKMYNQDPSKQYGFVSIPIYYRKYGVRFQGDFLLIDTCFDAVGLTVQTGVVDVRQTVTAYYDLTCTASPTSCPATTSTGTPMPTGTCTPATTDGATTCCNQSCCSGASCECKKLISVYAINQKEKIGKLLHVNFCNTYHKIGIDDIRLILFWRHIYDLNPGHLEDWPRVLFTPFAQAGVSVPMAKQVDPKDIFGVPIGNNGHTSVGGCAGFTMEFLDSIDIGAEAGFTHFFKLDYCKYPLPTAQYENGIYPYRADYTLHPGTNWHFALTMNAYHFLDRLTFWGQYVIVSHDQDRIKLCKSYIPQDSIFYPIPDTQMGRANKQEGNGQGFLVEFAECLTKWESHMANLAFTYDISPYVTLGFLWQAPIKRRNAYRSSTLLGSVSMTY